MNNYLQIAWGSILSAMIITAVEVLIHNYLGSRNENSETRSTVFDNLAYGSEFGKDQPSLENSEED